MAEGNFVFFGSYRVDFLCHIRLCALSVAITCPFTSAAYLFEFAYRLKGKEI